MNDLELSEVSEVIRKEIRSSLLNEIKEIRLIKECLDSLLEQKKQEIVSWMRFLSSIPMT
jgi:hypothetical protein